jgi:hypothetical protein
MNKRILMGALLLATLTLSACAAASHSNRLSYLAPFTDHEVSSMDDISLCNTAKTYNQDTRMDVVQSIRRINCEATLSCTKQGFKSGSKKLTSCLDLEKNKRDPAFSRCYDKGFKINTNAMASCIDLEKMKIADPAFNYCYDKGFKTGTQPMATCLASWNEQRQQQQQTSLMQEQLAEQRAQAAQAQEAQQRQNAMNVLQTLQRPQIAPPPPIQMPVQTNCQMHNGSMDCTTY